MANKSWVKIIISKGNNQWIQRRNTIESSVMASDFLLPLRPSDDLGKK